MPYYVAVQPVLCQCCFNGLEARDKDAAVTFLTLNYFISYEDQLHFNGVFWVFVFCFLSSQLHFFLIFLLTARLLPNMHLQSTSGWERSNKNTHAHSTDASIYCKGFARKLIFYAVVLCRVCLTFFYLNIFMDTYLTERLIYVL